jgi:hypothetical protein
MQFRLGILCFGGLLLTSSSCLAEPPSIIVQPVQGGLYVSGGQGFQPVDSPINANVGDSVMVAPGGAAMVAYPDGCKVAVQPGEVTTITRLSPCTNPFPPDGTVSQDTSSNGNAALAWGITGTVLGAGGLGAAVYAITKTNNSGTTTVNAGLSCGSDANPCEVSISP